MQIYKTYDPVTRCDFITVQAIFYGRAKADRVDVCIDFNISGAMEELRAAQLGIAALIKRHEDRLIRKPKAKSKKRR